MAPVVPLLLAGGKLGLKLLPAVGAVAGGAAAGEAVTDEVEAIGNQFWQNEN